MLSGWETVLLSVLVAVLMTGMGAALTVESFKEVLKRPVGVLIGLCSQFGWMPLLAYILATVLELPQELAIGLIVIGSAPGGTTSNMFTYFSRAHLALSLSMTAVSTVMAIVMMPLLLFVYGSSFTSSSICIPYREVVETLALTLIPVALGLMIRRRSAGAAKIIERAGAFAGVTVLILLAANGVLNHRELLFDSSPSLYLSAIGLGLVGMGAGYLTARVFRLKRAARRAVALETGIQNSPLAIAVIVLAFPKEQHPQLLWMPLLYALIVLCSSSIVTLIWRYLLPGVARDEVSTVSKDR